MSKFYQGLSYPSTFFFFLHCLSVEILLGTYKTILSFVYSCTLLSLCLAYIIQRLLFDAVPFCVFDSDQRDRIKSIAFVPTF
jgi:hypothetical protein